MDPWAFCGPEPPPSQRHTASVVVIPSSIRSMTGHWLCRSDFATL